MILRCAITQEQISKNRHNCYDCPGAEAITVALRAAGLERLLPVGVDAMVVMFRTDLDPDDGSHVIETPRVLGDWIKEYDDHIVAEVEPIKFDLKLPDKIVAAAQEEFRAGLNAARAAYGTGEMESADGSEAGLDWEMQRRACRESEPDDEHRQEGV